MSDEIPGQHAFKESIKIEIFYPDHVKRTVSKLFAKTRRNLIKKLDTPCWICGSKEDREVHHHHVEWAFANAIDWDKIKVQHPLFDWSTFKESVDFVDSEYNMLVLCEKHHRGNSYGIHDLPYPMWIVQKYLKEGFIFSNCKILPPQDTE